MRISRSFAILALAAACQKAEEPAPPPPPAPEAAAPAAAPAAPAKSDPACVGPMGEGSTVEVKAGKPDALTIGVLSDVKEDIPENLENVKTFLAAFKKAKADVIVVAGDTGLNQQQLQSSLDLIAGAGVPTFVIIGNREGKKDYAAAVAEVKKKHANLYDLDLVRRVDLPAVDLVSMPGYFNAGYLHSDDGCQYFQADVDALAEIVKGANSPVVLVSHGGPKQAGADAIDRTAEGDNVGDPMLTKAITDAKIPFGIFGNIHEAGGRATDLEGKMLEPKKPHPSMFLNPGPADSVQFGMNDGTTSVGMAAIVKVAKGQASYEIVRAIDKSAPVAKGGAKPKKK
jgi:Icc-related predicted phosphoesterase